MTPSQYKAKHPEKAREYRRKHMRTWRARRRRLTEALVSIAETTPQEDQTK
jgi:hypothetical protein